MYRAVLFDLFGTLIRFDATALPEVVVDGRPVRTTLGVWGDLLERTLPGVGVAAFARAIVDASADLDRERMDRHVEFPTRERFRRALARLGVDGDDGAQVAALFSRAHMRAIADATRFPPSMRASSTPRRDAGPSRSSRTSTMRRPPTTSWPATASSGGCGRSSCPRPSASGNRTRRSSGSRSPSSTPRPSPR